MQLKYRNKKWCIVATGFDCNNCLLLQLPPQATHHVMALPLIASSNKQEMFHEAPKKKNLHFIVTPGFLKMWDQINSALFHSLSLRGSANKQTPVCKWQRQNNNSLSLLSLSLSLSLSLTHKVQPSAPKCSASATKSVFHWNLPEVSEIKCKSHPLHYCTGVNPNPFPQSKTQQWDYSQNPLVKHIPLFPKETHLAIANLFL
jgi:hypothetical protein